MKYDIILCGVGGQGILSVAAVIATAAMGSGLKVRQSEVHGMAQRGGAVQAHLRIADGPIFSDLIGRGRADMILSMEPMESLRYLPYLAETGVLVSAKEPFVNIPDYPSEEELHVRLSSVPGLTLVETKETAVAAGSIRSANMVLIGAASAFLPVKQEALETAITSLFTRKGEQAVAMNITALGLGRQLVNASGTGAPVAKAAVAAAGANP